MRPRRGARHLDASGTGRPPRSAACRPTGRPSARCAAPSRRRSGSASAPRATRSSIATSGATRSSSKSKQADREALVVELEALAPAEGGGSNGADPADPARAGPLAAHAAGTSPPPVVRQGADPLSARFVERARATLLTPSRRRSRAPSSTSSRAARRWRSWCARVEGFLDRRGAAAGQLVAGAGRHAARGARLEHHRRPRRRRSRSGAAMAEEVRQAQASWSRLGPVPGETGRAAHRALPQRVQPLLRSVSPQGAAAAAAPRGASRSGRGRRRLKAGDSEVRTCSKSRCALTSTCFLYRTFPPTMV